MPEEVRTLWILAYYNETYYSLKPFYARSEADAEHQVQAWIEQQLPSRIKPESLRCFPGGFKFGTSELPGIIPNTDW